jgi:hypothetical protein
VPIVSASGDALDSYIAYASPTRIGLLNLSASAQLSGTLNIWQF